MDAEFPSPQMPASSAGRRVLIGRPLMRAALLLASVLIVGPALANAVYVSNEKDNTVSVIDSKTLAVTGTIPVGRRPRGIAISPDGASLYVCVSDDDGIDVIDTATLKVVRRLHGGADPELFALDPSGDTLYIANEDDAEVTALDVRTDKVVGTVHVGVEPEGMAVSPDGKTVVDTSETTSMAHFIDARTLRPPRQRAGRRAPALRGLYAGRENGLGQFGGRRPRQRDRRRDPPHPEDDRVRHPRSRSGDNPAGGHQYHP